MKNFWNSKKARKAIFLAKKYYGEKKDGSGTLIFDHCLRVSIHLFNLLEKININENQKESIICVGLFHDLIEDTNVSEKEIFEFGKNILDLTKQLTINFDKGIKKAVAPLYQIDDEAFLIKLADIYDNVSKSFFVIRINGIKWYETFFTPLLNEYLKLINFKRKNLKNKKLKTIILDFSDKVIIKIIQLKKIIKLYKKSILC